MDQPQLRYRIGISPDGAESAFPGLLEELRQAAHEEAAAVSGRSMLEPVKTEATSGECLTKNAERRPLQLSVAGTSVLTVKSGWLQVKGDSPRPSQMVAWMSDHNLLTPRESEVMRGLARGRLNKEIAAELGISFSAIHKHQHKIIRKLHVGNRTEAALKWMLARREV